MKLKIIIFTVCTFSCLSLSALVVCASDSPAANVKLYLGYEEAIAWDYVTHERHPGVGRYNYFQLGNGGPKIYLGEHLDHLIPFLHADRKSKRLLRKINRAGKFRKALGVIALTSFLCAAFFFNWTPVLLLSIAAMIAAVTAWVCFLKRGERLLAKLIYYTNSKNGF